MIHWYCRKLLKTLLKQVENLQEYKVKHKYWKRSDAYLFEYRGYKKIVKGCCCKYSAAFSGFAHWLSRNKGAEIRRAIKRSVKNEQKIFNERAK